MLLVDKHKLKQKCNNFGYLSTQFWLKGNDTGAFLFFSLFITFSLLGCCLLIIYSLLKICQTNPTSLGFKPQTSVARFCNLENIWLLFMKNWVTLFYHLGYFLASFKTWPKPCLKQVLNCSMR